MAFWSMTGSLSMASPTEKVLDKHKYTLADLLACDDILNQVLMPNDRLIRYICRPDIICELMQYALTPPLTKEEFEDSKKNNEDEESNTDPADEVTKPLNPMDPIDSPPTRSKAFKNDSSYTDTSDSDFSETADEEDQYEDERMKRLKYSKISSEILCTDVWNLLDTLIASKKAMGQIWDLLGNPDADATGQQLTMVTRILEALLEKRIERFLDLLKTLPDFVDYFIKYIECQPLMDFLIKVISTDHPDSPTDIISVLYDQNLVPKMIELLNPEVPHSAQSATGDFLKAFINISGGNKSDLCAIGPNELSRQFVNEKCMGRLVDIMLKGGHGMCVGVAVIIEVIRKNNSDYDLVEVMQTTLESHPPHPRDNIYLGTMVKLFAKAIPHFQKILSTPETKEIDMPFGKIKPLGFERFRICELYAELLHCSNMNLLNDPNGENVIREREQERIRVYHPEQLASLLFEEGEKNNQKEDSAGENAASQKPSNANATDSATNDQDKTDKPATGKPDSAKDSDTSTSSLNLSADYTDEGSFYSANNSGASEKDDSWENQNSSTPPLSPANISDSPLASPSSATYETPEDLGFDDSNRQRTAISQLRGNKLIQSLDEENKALRKNTVAGDLLKIALDDNNCINTVFNLLFEYPWNNFLHNVVFDIVQQVFNGFFDYGYNKFLAISLFTNGLITEKIVEGHRSNAENEQNHNIRLGYVGHLTLVSEEVVKFETVFIPESLSPDVATALSNPAWLEYTEGELVHLREQYNTVLGKAGMITDDEDTYDQSGQNILSMDLELLNNNEPVLQVNRFQDTDSDSESDSDSDNEDTFRRGTEESQFSRFMSGPIGSELEKAIEDDSDDSDDEFKAVRSALVGNEGNQRTNQQDNGNEDEPSNSKETDDDDSGDYEDGSWVPITKTASEYEL